MSEIKPLAVIGLVGNENAMPPLLVLCRAPADDGWLCIEAGTAIIYNVFDFIAHRYVPWEARQANHPDLKTWKARGRLLERAMWFHVPAGHETVGAP